MSDHVRPTGREVGGWIHRARCWLVVLLVLTAISQTLSDPSVAAPGKGAALPFPQHTPRSEGTISPPSFTQATLDADVRRAYRRWKRDHLVDAGVDARGRRLYRVSFGSADPARTVSEGQAYGMLIAVHMAGADPAARKIFNGLWRYSRQFPSSIDPGLMSFSVPSTGGNSAFDGDADIAYALILADAQWGSNSGLNYAKRARRVLRSIERSTIGPESRLPMLGDWVDPDSEGTYNQYTWRSSDCMPGHFFTFASFTGRTLWRQVAARCLRQLGSLQRRFSPGVGLVPDFVVVVNGRPRPAPAGFLEGPLDGSYSYNAVRVPWRVGIDAIVTGRPRSRAVAARFGRWVADEAATDPMSRLGGGYALDGTIAPGRGFFTSVVAAPLAVSVMTTPDHGETLDELYRAVRTRREDYFEDSVTVLSMLAISGNWIDVS